MNVNDQTKRFRDVIDSCNDIYEEIQKKHKESWTPQWTSGTFKTLEEKTDLLREKINSLANDDIVTFSVKLIEKDVFNSLETIMPILNQYKGSISATTNQDKRKGVINETGLYSITTLVNVQVYTIKKEAEMKLIKIDPSYEISKEENGYCILF